MSSQEQSLSPQEQGPFLRLPEVQKGIRRAVEERNYKAVLGLVEEQQSMFRAAGPGHPEVPHFAQRAHELTVWALTMVRLQRAHTENAIRQITSARRVADIYNHSSLDPTAAFNARLRGEPMVAQG